MENRPRMDRAERAKQFMPFDALKGLREALREKEKIIVPKIELSDYAKSILDRKLHQIEKNDMLTVVYFEKGQYVKYRVFFADEETAIAAGYRPCAKCMPDEYKKWKEKNKP